MADSCDAVRVDLERVRGMQSLLDPDAPPLREGDQLPPLWHWAAAARWSATADTGADGHPRRASGLARTPLRRMFAGGEITFGDVELRVGAETVTTTELGEPSVKTGRSGDFVLVASTSTMRDPDGRLLMTERQDVVYVEAQAGGLEAPLGPLPVVGRPLVPRRSGEAELRTDPTVLLRVSAVTANTHRVHYDLAYARDTESLPGLLVHGPFITMALVQVARGIGSGRRVRRVRHRNLHPLFVGQPATLTASWTSPSEINAEAAAADGRTTTRVVLELDDREA